jgi:hypothetical protein
VLTRPIPCLIAGLLLLCAARVADAQTGTITLLSQERVLVASLPNVPPPQQRVESGTGAFVAEEEVEDVFSDCTPGGCVRFVLAESRARQNSLIAVTPDGGLVIQADGSVYGRQGTATPIGHAVSRLTATFSVEGAVSYSLWAEGDGNAPDTSVTLTKPSGAVVGHDEWTGRLTDAGRLTGGTYTLTVESSGDTYAEYGLRFSATPLAVPGKLYCGVVLEQRSYVAGETVRGTFTLGSVDVPTPGVTPIELKMWMKQPDGTIVPGLNAGADGSFLLFSHGAFPFELFPVGPDTAPGLYEVGCRVLEPRTGDKLDEHVFVFQVHDVE